MAFRGTFDHSLDAKNRLTVPSKFRAALSGGLVIAAAIEPCVAIWPAADYDAFVTRSVSQFPELSPERRKLTRFFSANAFDAELDSAGRVMVPPKLLAHAGLTKEAVVVGADGSLELWDRTRWAEYEDDISPEDITQSLGHPS
ncbi:MAG: division/cell wall cluster transcriptional repressor MraZ [Solirubrobacteraceae bacterium]|nr:division/cell wall cluster transcriptional repressor MraZ [Solirubrobacteraceae bacterium]